MMRSEILANARISPTSNCDGWAFQACKPDTRPGTGEKFSYGVMGSLIAKRGERTIHGAAVNVNVIWSCRWNMERKLGSEFLFVSIC